MINDKNRFDIEYILKENTTIDMDKYKSFSEETKVNISDKVSAKIIGSIRKKINKEYFEYIQKSKGNIKNLKDYQNLKKSISLIQSIFNKNNMSTVDMKKSISISLMIVLYSTFKLLYKSHSIFSILIKNQPLHQREINVGTFAYQGNFLVPIF